MAAETRTVRASGSTGTHEVEIAVGPSGLPADAQIPALAAAARRGVAAVLGDLGVETSGEVALLKYHAGERCAFFAPTAAGGVAVKAYADDPAPVVDQVSALARHGLASGSPPTVAPLVAWDRGLRLVVTDWFAAPSAIE